VRNANQLVTKPQEKGLTQEQLAKLIGTKQSGIARTERGTTYPTIELLERIANKLGIYLSIEFKETETHTKTWDHPNNNSQLIESAYFSINNFSLTQPHQDSKTKN
jgi:transcriptional regulator with XRE-family HTH domain